MVLKRNIFRKWTGSQQKDEEAIRQEIESLGIDSERVIIVHNGGRVEDFRKCIFPGCRLLYSTRLNKCPALGLSFAEEEKRREENRKREQQASRAEEDY